MAVKYFGKARRGFGISVPISKFTQTRQHFTSRCRLALCYNELVTGNGSLSPVASRNSLPPGRFY